MSPLGEILFVIVRIIAAGFAFTATAKHPYDFYVVTRWIVFLTCGWGAFLSYRRPWPSPLAIYIVVGILFNPLFQLHFSRGTWHNLDILAGVALLGSLLFQKSPPRTER